MAVGRYDVHTYITYMHAYVYTCTYAHICVIILISTLQPLVELECYSDIHTFLNVWVLGHLKTDLLILELGEEELNPYLSLTL